MKKPLIYSITLAATLLTATAGIITATIATATTDDSTDSVAEIAAQSAQAAQSTQAAQVAQSTQLAEASTPLATKPAVNTKDETVYAITSTDGAASTLFVGSSLYTGSESLPISMSIKYYLDGSEISADTLKGKSGHVKITYTYSSEIESSGKKVPFLAITGLTLDSTKFSNIKLENGKIISDRDQIILVGYAMPGLNEDFGTDLLPSEFTLEADVANFALGNTYTIFTNDFFKDIDTSKLSRIDDLRSSLSKLSNGLDQIISGSSDLSSGLASALDGSKQLYSGSRELAAGISTATAGAATLSDGLSYLATKNDALTSGARAIITSTITELAEAGINVTATDYSEILTAAIDNYTTQYAAVAAAPAAAPAGTLDTLETTVTQLTKAKSLLDFSTGVIGYTDGVASAADGAAALKAGLATINTKTPELVSGLGSLVSGTEQLYTGSVQLHDGLTTLKSSGIDKLTRFAEGDLAAFTSNARATVSAARSYNHFSIDSAKTVKFIVKTPSIK